MNLFEIVNEIDKIFEEAELNEGELGEEALGRLQIAEQNLNDKLYAYAYYCDKLDKDNSLLKEYKQALDDRIKRNENKKAKLKQVIADCVWKFGEPVMKKNKDTGEKEETGSYSLKYPNISFTVKKLPNVIEYSDSITKTLNECYDNFNSSENIPEQLKNVIDIKYSPALGYDTALKLKSLLADNNMEVLDGDFKFFVNTSNLKKQLEADPTNLDAWDLDEKDSVTIRK